jgi:hypothetical protein
MAATKDQMRRSIDVGSLPFGQRQAFESSLGEVGAATPAPVGARQPTPGNDLGIPGNPLDPMLAGDVSPSQDPLTSGLSVGPGPGPVGSGVAPISDDSVERLRIVAMNAASPVLRNMARRALRGTVKEFRSA